MHGVLKGLAGSPLQVERAHGAFPQADRGAAHTQQVGEFGAGEPEPFAKVGDLGGGQSFGCRRSRRRARAGRRPGRRCSVLPVPTRGEAGLVGLAGCRRGCVSLPANAGSRLSTAGRLAHRRLRGAPGIGPRRRWRGCIGRHLDAEDVGQIVIRDPRAASGTGAGQRSHGVGATCDQLRVVHAAQYEQQFRGRVQTRTDAVEHGGDVLAQPGDVRTRAAQPDLLRLWEQPAVTVGDRLHDAVGEPAGEQFDQRVDAASAVPAQFLPAARWQRRDLDLDLVEFAAHDQRLHRTTADRQVTDRIVANVAAATLQAIGEVGELLQVFAPGPAPEAARDAAPADLDRVDATALLA